MTHKHKMQKLKEEDPITYYELTSDPTGVGGGDNSDVFGCFMTLTIAVVIGGIIYLCML